MLKDTKKTSNKPAAKTTKKVKAAVSVEREKKETTEEYRQRIVGMVCEVTTVSSQGMDRICKAFKTNNPDFPDETTIRRWFKENEELAKQYARAKEDQIEKLVEEIIDISDDSSLDIAFNDDGKPFVDHEHIARSKLRVDSRKWIASKLKPKKYGDKLELAGDPQNPLTINVVKFSDSK